MMRKLVNGMFMLMAGVVFADTLHAAIEIRSDYPGGNVKVLGIDETSGVVRVAPDLRDTEGKWFHFDFTVRGAAGRRRVWRPVQVAERKARYGNVAHPLS